MNAPTVIDLFCGAGGFSYGFKQAGFDVVLGIDNNANKLTTYKKNITPSIIQENIQLITKRHIKDMVGDCSIDVVIGSPPCQFFSNGTNKKSNPCPVNFFLNHFLLFEFIRIIDIIRPKFFIIENVPKFFNSSIAYYGQFLLSQLNYTINLEIIDCANYGLPQKRKRGFLIGNTLHKNIYLKPQTNTASIRDAISDLETLEPLAQNTHTPLYLKNNDLNKFTEYQRLMHSKNKKLPIYNHISPNNTTRVTNQLSTLAPGEYYISNPNNPNKSHQKSFYDTPSKPITTGFGSPSNDGETMHPNLPRCLTFREAARLQSFNDDFIFYGATREIRLQIGDAVPPLISYQYAEIIRALLENGYI